MTQNKSKGKVTYIGGLGSAHIGRVMSLFPKDLNVEAIDVNIGENEVISRALDSDYIMLEAATLPERLLREAPHLKLVQSFHQGVDRIPVDVATQRGIPVANVGGIAAAVVAEHAIMLMLSVCRCLPTQMSIVKTNRPNFVAERARLYTTCYLLYGKTVGIVGMGNIGRKVAQILHGFETNIIYHDAIELSPQLSKELGVKKVTLQELLKSSDIVTIHVPLTKSTRGLINRDGINMMKPSAILINTSRGPVIDEQALIQALKENRLAGAGLDVQAKEPPDLDNPLLQMENVIITPHVAGFVREHFGTSAKVASENVLRMMRGEPLINVVNKV